MTQLISSNFLFLIPTFGTCIISRLFLLHNKRLSTSTMSRLESSISEMFPVRLGSWFGCILEPINCIFNWNIRCTEEITELAHSYFYFQFLTQPILRDSSWYLRSLHFQFGLVPEFVCRLELEHINCIFRWNIRWVEEIGNRNRNVRLWLPYTMNGFSLFLLT